MCDDGRYRFVSSLLEDSDSRGLGSSKTMILLRMEVQLGLEITEEGKGVYSCWERGD